MKEKCSKYESLFIFSDEKDLTEHINNCEDCKAEHEQMQKVSALLKEVAPHYQKKKKSFANKIRFLQAACMLFILFVGGLSTTAMLDSKYGILDTVKYGAPLTMEDMGFQTDNYGLIQVDE